MCIWDIMTPTLDRIICLIVMACIWITIDQALQRWVSYRASLIFFVIATIVSMLWVAYNFYTGVILWC